jgi:hypothetical protein
VLVAKTHAEAARAAMEYEFCFRTQERRAFVKIDVVPVK